MLDIANINNHPEIYNSSLRDLNLDKLNFGVKFQQLTYNCQTSAISDIDLTVPRNLGRILIKTNADTGYSNPDKFNIPLGIVGARYKPMLNSAIFDVLKNCLITQLPSENLEDAVLTETLSRNGAFSRFEIMFPKMESVIDQSGRYNNTKLNFRIAVNNTFDGSGRLVIDAGFFDQICSNGLKLGSWVTDTSKHTESLTEDKIEYFISEQIEHSKDKIEMIQNWSNTKIAVEDANNLINKFFSEQLAKKVNKQLDNEIADRGNSIWSLVSTLTYWSSSDNVRNKGVEFGVRNTGNDNIASTLHARQKIVDNILKSKDFQELSLVA